MPSFVLVHGGAHGAWCWQRLIPHLRADPRVEVVVAVDLTGHGARRDAKPRATIVRDDYVDDVVRSIEAGDLREVLLVGHSLAGITIPRVAARLPDRIRRVIHLTTSHPPSGQSILERMEHPLSPLSRGLDARTMFCNDLDDASAAWLLERLGPEPPGPLSEPIEPVVLPGAVPSTYILCTRDEALPPAYQREQAQAAGVDEIVPFDAGHSAFVSRPAELAELLLRYA